jgi:hypothetical protein
VDCHTQENGWSYLQKENKRDKRVHLYGGRVTENIIQALARICTFDATIRISKRYKVVLQVHDEVVFLVPENEIEEAAQWSVDVMSTPPEWGKDIPLAAECEYGKGYSKMIKTVYILIGLIIFYNRVYDLWFYI